MFKKILIANRGEIACRIIKTARRMGITTVAIYSTADCNSLHVSLADEAFCVGLPAASESYLNIDAIIAIAKQTETNAIHPGYGFLSENAVFAQACADAGIIFIGPTLSALEIMGSKQRAKQLLEKTTVPLTPGYHGIQQSDTILLTEAERLGFPVLLKAANGGGGKGMRAVHHVAGFMEALAGARREAKAYFADDTMLIEKLIQQPRHIEMQIMADNHGQILHLFERDCSIQRRHQKIIEEAPAAHLSQTLRQQLANAAIDVARAIEYRGAGTVEFLVTHDEQFYFMEMNTRLQVEHPVTEMITGLDLVEWQLRIAANEPLPCTQAQIHARGHAIECRVCAEDPTQDFMPSIGQVHFLKEPSGEHIRLDSSIVRNDFITMYYDPMIAKLIVWGETRAEALQRLRLALARYYIGGVKTNLAFLKAIIEHPRFVDAQFDTDFLNHTSIEIPPTDPLMGLFMAASIDYLQLRQAKDCLGKDTLGFQMHLPPQWCSRYLINNERYDVAITPISSTEMTLHWIQNPEKTIRCRIYLTDNQLQLDDGQQIHRAYFEVMPTKLIIYTENGPITIDRFNGLHVSHNHSYTDNRLTAPMPATVVAILKQKGEAIKLGDSLMVLEAMKMEHTIHAPKDGILSHIFYTVGEQVQEGAELITLEPNELEPISHE